MRVLVLALEDGVPRHDNGRGLLVEASRDIGARVGVSVGERRYPQPLPARGVQVGGLELQESVFVARRVGLLICDIEVEGDGRVPVHRPDDPMASAALADLLLRHRWAPLPQGRETPHGAAALELTGRENLDLAVESQVQVALVIAIKHLPEGVLEDAHAEAVAHHHVPAGLVGQHFHLMQADLVEGASEQVYGEAIGNSPGC
mmetsp:Transcript_113903/g.328983  ORF Transcript_113903/g.328983 Transcript_113903/m.328983 type:complete len:203 (-) Transcript_113903:976-1584(-)